MKRIFIESMDEFFESKDPLETRLMDVTIRSDDSVIVERFLDDNRERLSPKAQKFLESSIALKKFKQEKKSSHFENIESPEGVEAISEEAKKIKEAEGEKLWDRHILSADALFRLKNDPHRERVLALIGRARANGPVILERFLDDNRERLSPTIKKAIEDAMAWEKFEDSEES